MSAARLSETPRWPPTAARTPIPAGAWDCHFHVFTGPGGKIDRAAFSPARDYEPPPVGLTETRRRPNACSTKITGPTRINARPAPEHPDVRPLAEALVAAASDRLVWGSDWPHVALWGRMPGDGDLVDDLARWGLDEAARRRVLVDNPRRLYGDGPQKEIVLDP